MHYNFLNVYNENKHTYPILLSFPHSGTTVPENIRCCFRPNVVLPNTDWFLPELFGLLLNEGISGIETQLSRYVIDLNRNLKSEVLGSYKNLIYGYTTQGYPIYLNV